MWLCEAERGHCASGVESCSEGGGGVHWVPWGLNSWGLAPSLKGCNWRRDPGWYSEEILGTKLRTLRHLRVTRNPSLWLWFGAVGHYQVKSVQGDVWCRSHIVTPSTQNVVTRWETVEVEERNEQQLYKGALQLTHLLSFNILMGKLRIYFFLFKWTPFLILLHYRKLLR